MSTTDIAWAAGFLEGEGYFGLTPPHRRRAETQRVRRYARITCRQMEREALDRLQDLFGGTICRIEQPKNLLSPNPIWDWNLTGAGARGVMMTLFTFLTRHRRAPITKALASDTARCSVSTRKD